MPQAQKGAKRPRGASRERGVAADGKTEQPSVQADELSFEASLDRLEGVVDQLERGELELEASLAAFEEGVQLSARCSSLLASAEQRIETLTQEGGNWVSRPFESDVSEVSDVSDAEVPEGPDGMPAGASGSPAGPAGPEAEGS